MSGKLNIGVAASDVSFVINYTGGNSGPYTLQNLSSSDVVGLTATLQPGSFTNGDGSLIFTVSGTPSSSGNALFILNIAGQVCFVSLTVESELKTFGIPGPPINDVDGNLYKTVYIGNQQWMAENLKVTKYTDGKKIPNITDGSLWSNLKSGAWSYFKYDSTHNVKYGKLYNWYSVSPTMNGNKNICPDGWHVPSDNDWTKLADYLGGANIAGNKMKETGMSSWKIQNNDATNISLFTALPGGYNSGEIYSEGPGYGGAWWTSTENSSENAWKRGLNYSRGDLSRESSNKSDGLSVRCLKD
jgi:uncharacterized protein (TIGR02145 family)